MNVSAIDTWITATVLIGMGVALHANFESGLMISGIMTAILAIAIAVNNIIAEKSDAD